MDRIYRQQERPLSENMYVAVAIAEPDADQRHTGLFFRFSATDQHEFLHLAWHCQLRREMPGSEYVWIDPAISSRRLKQVAAICDQIATTNSPEGIPYSFGPPDDCFDEKDCRFLLGPTTTGLTCASFVLAVFHRAGLQLVKYKSWPKPSEEDVRWQHKILEALEKRRNRARNPVTDEHIQAVRSEVGNSSRYRPEHVAAAAVKFKSSPVNHRCVKRLGASIVAFIRGELPNSQVSLWERFRNAIGCWIS